MFRPVFRSERPSEHSGRARRHRSQNGGGAFGAAPIFGRVKKCSPEVFTRALRSDHRSEHRTLNACFPNTEQCSGPTLQRTMLELTLVDGRINSRFSPLVTWSFLDLHRGVPKRFYCLLYLFVRISYKQLLRWSVIIDPDFLHIACCYVF